jgi:hypothetical protein
MALAQSMLGANTDRESHRHRATLSKFIMRPVEAPANLERAGKPTGLNGASELLLGHVHIRSPT